MQPQDIEFYFMPFSELKLSESIPVVAYVFEGQEDSAIDAAFPEIEKLRTMTDCNEDNEADTVLFFPIQRESKAYVVGVVYIALRWKKKRKFDIDSINFYSRVKERSAVMVRTLRELHHEEVVIILPGQFHPRNINSDKQRDQLLLFIQTLTEICMCANDTLDDFKKKSISKVKRVTFTYFGQYEQGVNAFFQKAIGDGCLLGGALVYAQRLIEIPPNHKYPLKLVEQATGYVVKKCSGKGRAGRLGWRRITSNIFSKKTRISILSGLEVLRNHGEYGFGLIAAVGQGSVHEPCLLKVHYKPRSRRKKQVKKVSLIGKGVTFDTGGVDLKLTGAYDKMHYDMAGAATVLGAIKLADEKDLPVEIVGLIPLVHNAISSHAYNPHDIITAFDGKHVEIKNTDCEGRLILADALAYSEGYVRPDCTITVATLCGMEDVTLDILKVLATNDVLEKRVRVAEHRALEKVMLWPKLEYLNALDDEYVNDTNADMTNDIPFGDHSAGPVFMSNFLNWERPLNWIYIDISAVFHKDAPDYCAGPGFGLRFLWNVLRQFA